MLLQEPIRVEKRCPRWWSFGAAAGLTALAVLVSGIGLRAAPAALADEEQQEKKIIRARVVNPDDPKGEKRTIILEFDDGDDKKPEKKTDKKKEEIKKREIKVLGPINVDEILKNLPEGVDRDQIRRALEQAQKAIHERMKDLPDGIDGEQLRKRIQEKLKDLPEGINREEIRKRVGEAFELRKADAEKWAKDAAKMKDVWQKDAEKWAKDAVKWRELAQGDAGKLKETLQGKLTFAHAEGHGQVRLGVMVSAPGAALADQLDLPKGRGLVIEQVQPGTPAAKAGLKANDVLLEVNDKPVKSDPGELVEMLEGIKPGAAIEVTILRKGKKETVKVSSLGEAKGAKRTLVKPEGEAKGAKRVIVKPDDAPQVFSMPKVPGVQGLQGLPGQSGMFAFSGTGGGVITTTFRNDDRFTTRHQEGSLIITVTGTVEDGKAKTSGITVQDGKETHKYERVSGVPEQYRDKVKNLVEMSEKGSVKVEIRKEKKAEPKEQPKRKRVLEDGGDA